MNKLSLSITILFGTFFSPCIFSTNLFFDRGDQKEESYSTESNNQMQQPKQVCDYTIVNNKNINHTLYDIENVEDDLRNYVLGVDQKLVASNNQSSPLILGAVLQHKQTYEYHQYLIADTGLLSEATQSKAVKRAYKKGFHLIKATYGHVGLQLLEWLQISKYYSVTALYTNRPVCRNCYLIAHSLWEKELSNNEKGCLGTTFPLLDKMPNLARQYINTHLNFSLVQNLVVPMMGYISKEEMNKVIQKKDKEKDHQLEEKDEKINMLNKEINKKDNQLNDKSNTISSLTSVIKEREQKIAELENILEEIPKKPLDGNTKKELFKAIGQSNVKKVRELLYTYKNVVNVRDEYERTPFLYAARKGHLEIAKVLRERGANLNAKDKWENNTLHAACSDSGSVEMVTWLLDVCKIGLETKGNYEMTPFLYAAQKGQLAITKLLKERGASIHAKDVCSRKALHWACYYSGSVEMVTWLLDECKVGLETKGENQRTPFLYAVEKGQLAIAKLLKERGADIHAEDADGDNALHLACEFSGSVHMTTWLLDVCKIGLEAKGQYERTPFLFAVQKGQLKVVKLLRERGANINAKDYWGDNALHLAPKWQKKLINYLLSLGLR